LGGGVAAEAVAGVGHEGGEGNAALSGDEPKQLD
jgi:hypothetical protein